MKCSISCCLIIIIVVVLHLGDCDVMKLEILEPAEDKKIDGVALDIFGHVKE